MAFIQMNVMSESLLRTVNVNVILPADKIQMPDKDTSPVMPQGNFKTLYLLHGIFGSQVDWINGTCLQRWAEERNLAVVMPAGDNHFYIDHPITHENYGQFVGKELVELTRRIFPLSRKKEDTFIGGLSMGGYGALRNGLKYHDTFGHIAALSAAALVDYPDNAVPFLSEAMLTHIFGDMEQARHSDNSLCHLMQENCRLGCNHQKIYLACGQSDPLRTHTNQLLHDLTANGYEVTAEYGEGAHEWDFWNRYIQRVINWLPLDDIDQGITSGNVGM